MEQNSQETTSDSQLTNQYRRFVSAALQSTKTYVDMGGDAYGINVLGALFKWPDVIYDLIDMLDGKESAREAFISDVGCIMLDPLVAITKATLEVTNITDEEKEAYQTILDKRPVAGMREIIAHKNLIVNILVKLQALKEKEDENRNSGSCK